MNSIVIYFSITGNTRKIAEAIQKGMKSLDERCDIARLKDIDTPDLQGYDLIGLGSPVMWLKEFDNVTAFIEHTMRGVEGKHAFAFSTHGALPAQYFLRVIPAMKQRGVTVIGWNDWYGGVYFPCVPKPYFTDGHPDAIDLQEAEDFGREMVERSRRIHRGETNLIPTLPRGKEYDDLYDPVLMNNPEEARKTKEKRFADALSVGFSIDKKKCNYPKCTFCMDNCPMNAIDLSVDPPLFNRNCGMCWMCEMACPKGAINFDFVPFDAAHPVIHGESILEDTLEIMEARGRFRRLVPMEEIGWDTPVWKLKKPRYKVK